MSTAPPAGVPGRLAIMAATSGHSGVDRVVGNLTRQLDDWGIGVDLLRVHGHGPHLDREGLRHVRAVDLGTRHVNTALPALVRYLRRARPVALLTDKDRVNRIAILARAAAGGGTRLAVRLGTTVSINLADRGRVERWAQRASMRWLYPFADRVIVPSAGVADDLAAYTGLARDHIQVVRSPIITAGLPARAAAPVDHPWLAPGQPPVILGVGELGYRKDFETLIRALARLAPGRPARLLILGRGRRRERLIELAATLGVGERVDLPGFVANPYAYMARASLFVLSSRWEGMPVALIEALACGTPAVSTDCPSGPRELLADGRAGALVPVGDAGAMAAAMDRWLDAPHPPRQVFDAVVADYRIEASARAYLDALGVPVPGPEGAR